jgi:hypothetical protein
MISKVTGKILLGSAILSASGVMTSLMTSLTSGVDVDASFSGLVAVAVVSPVLAFFAGLKKACSMLWSWFQ